MVVCAFWQKGESVWDEFRPRFYDGYSAREAIALYREHYNIKGVRGVCMMIGNSVNDLRLWRGSVRKTMEK